MKCRAGESWLRDILMDEGTPPWDIQPTPNPDLPEARDEVINELLGDKVAKFIEELGAAPKVSEVEQLKEVAAQELRFSILQDAQTRANRMKLRIADQFAEGRIVSALEGGYDLDALARSVHAHLEVLLS